MSSPSLIPVAIFLTRFEPGGTERQLIELVRRLNPRRFDVRVACFDRKGRWSARVLEHGVPVVEFPIHGFAQASTVAQMLAFARWCRRERIAVVQTCGLYTNIFALPGAELAGVPVRIGSRRELNSDKSPGLLRLQRHAYRAATKVVANSQAARRMLEQEGVAPPSIAVIPNGIDRATFPERETLGAIQTVITVANLRPEKQHETLIAAAELVCRRPDHRFQIVGDGPRGAALDEHRTGRADHRHRIWQLMMLELVEPEANEPALPELLGTRWHLPAVARVHARLRRRRHSRREVLGRSRRPSAGRRRGGERA